MLKSNFLVLDKILMLNESLLVLKDLTVITLENGGNMPQMMQMNWQIVHIVWTYIVTAGKLNFILYFQMQ